MLTDREIFESTVLIVDDELNNIELLEQILSQEGYSSLISTKDSRMAQELYVKHQPDLVILDLMMPYLNGFEVIDRLSEIEKDSYAPILVLTAQADYDNRLRALEGGARDFLGKPFDYLEVLCRTRNILEVRILHKKLKGSNINLEKVVRERTLDLEKTQLEIIHRLGRASEYRDRKSGLHSIRIGKLCRRLAQAYGLKPRECDLIENASPLHDVGKIGIPDEILLKTGELEPAEWNIMKSHPEIGAKILSGSNSELLQLAEKIALTHQERWDGTGYPNSLEGEEIPLEGRIVALCDTFDSLIHHRPYAQKLSCNGAMDLIEEKKGVDFDPVLVDIFRDNLNEMIRIINAYTD